MFKSAHQEEDQTMLIMQTLPYTLEQKSSVIMSWMIKQFHLNFKSHHHYKERPQDQPQDILILNRTQNLVSITEVHRIQSSMTIAQLALLDTMRIVHSRANTINFDRSNSLNISSSLFQHFLVTIPPFCNLFFVSSSLRSYKLRLLVNVIYCHFFRFRYLTSYLFSRYQIGIYMRSPFFDTGSYQTTDLLKLLTVWFKCLVFLCIPNVDIHSMKLLEPGSQYPTRIHKMSW